MPISALISIIFLQLFMGGIWKYGNKTENGAGKQPVGELPVSRMPLHYYLPSTFVFIFLFVAIGYILLFWTDSNVPWWDSLTTALSVVALWMLAHKYVEQWLVWIVIDVACCGIYVYKGLYFTAFLYGFYAVVAIFGYLKWKKMMQ